MCIFCMAVSQSVSLIHVVERKSLLQAITLLHRMETRLRCGIVIDKHDECPVYSMRPFHIFSHNKLASLYIHPGNRHGFAACEIPGNMLKIIAWNLALIIGDDVEEGTHKSQNLLHSLHGVVSNL
jgi:hypothetical protein